ncbi:MAG: hypothetical protein HYW89_00890 [Candidatus Sungiibacteriota bacterium]|uniref:Tetratricopeptide repeat protein n=1 Tax=Candidatus Sungiibacteriota bacterium TaxID=2750080 RepID=A0A7T5UQS1_9BACT|nr:MAG: hypothetical protein HYW89_00890 [Candidatus Sungbacteria bacterium]
MLKESFYKNAILGLLVLVIVVAGIFFQDEISRFLSLNLGKKLEPSAGSAPLPQIPKNTEVPESASLPTGQTKTPLGANPDTRTTAGLPPPPYIGRDPIEVRPIPEEVKLFTEAQKQELYASLDMHGRSVKARPNFFTGWIQVGIFKKIIGDFEGARDAWEYASLLEPLNSLSFANLGELYWRYLKDFPKAEANLKISLKNKPADVQTHVSLAELYYYSYKEKAEEADDVLLRGLEANPQNQTLMSRLAYLYEQRKEWGKALEWWQKVNELFPGDSDVESRITKIKLRLEPAP